MSGGSDTPTQRFSQRYFPNRVRTWVTLATASSTLAGVVWSGVEYVQRFQAQALRNEERLGVLEARHLLTEQNLADGMRAVLAQRERDQETITALRIAVASLVAVQRASVAPRARRATASSGEAFGSPVGAASSVPEDAKAAVQRAESLQARPDVIRPVTATW